jgi:hypothetical protein
MGNGMSYDIFLDNTILYGYYISCHFLWYVERHITPHGLRVMALRSWRTLICHLEAPNGQSNQSGLRYFKRKIIK